MRKTTITCNKCGKEIKSNDYFTTVSVTERGLRAIPAVLGWSDTDNYDFCSDCHKRNEVRKLLIYSEEE